MNTPATGGIDGGAFLNRIILATKTFILIFALTRQRDCLMNTTAPPARPAFTLIELLVVIAIISLLLAILLPALAAARSSSRQTACASNLRSVGQSLVTYSNDFRGLYPYWSVTQVFGGDGTGDDSPGLGWPELLQEYSAGTQVYQDPSRPRDLIPFAYFMQSRWEFHRTGEIFTSLDESDIQLTAQFVLGGDCNRAGMFPPPYGTAKFDTPDCDLDDASHPAVFFPEKPGDAEPSLIPHEGNTNILFADAHVKAFRDYSRDEMTWHAAKLTDWFFR